MLVSDLIRDAYILGKILNAQGLGYDAPKQQIGLRLLNSIIDEINIDGREIVVNDSLTIESPTDQYTLHGWIAISNATYRIGNVENPMKIVDLGTFYKDPYLDNVVSIPYMGYFARKDLDVLELNFYFDPAGSYPVSIYGTKAFQSLDLNDDIDASVRLYKPYLRELLIRDLRAYHNKGEDARNISKISEINSRLLNIKDVDRSVEPSPLNSGGDTTLDKIARDSVLGNMQRGLLP